MAAVFYLWWLGAAPRAGKIERFSKASWEAAVAAGGKFPTWQAAVLAGDKFRPCVGKGATTDEWCDRMFQRALLGIAQALLLRLQRPCLAVPAGSAPKEAAAIAADAPAFGHAGATATATRSRTTATPSGVSAPSGTPA